MHKIPIEYVDRIAVTPRGCWEWTGSLDTYGYASVTHQGRTRMGHKLMYELLVGEVPPKLELDHLCRIRHCVNPVHLEVVTHRENVLRSTGPAAIAAQATHCPSGHPYEGRNLVVFADGKRRCRACRNERDKAWKKQARRRRNDADRVGDSSPTV